MPKKTTTPRSSQKPAPSPGGRARAAAQNPGGNPGKTVREGPMRPQAHGGALKSGGTLSPGRPPNEWRDRMASMASREETEQYLMECLTGQHGKVQYRWAYQYVTEQAYGKATSRVEVGGTDKPVSIIVRRE